MDIRIYGHIQAYTPPYRRNQRFLLLGHMKVMVVGHTPDTDSSIVLSKGGMATSVDASRSLVHLLNKKSSSFSWDGDIDIPTIFKN